MILKYNFITAKLFIHIYINYIFIYNQLSILYAYHFVHQSNNR